MEKGNELFEQFRSNDNLFDEKPKDQLWNKLEQRLDQKKNVKKMRFYRIMTFAATLFLLVGAVAYFNHYLTDHNPKYYVSNESFTAYPLEDIKNDDSFFNTASISQVKDAYSKATAVQDETISIGGNYNAAEGSISFDITLSNFVYILDFDFDGFSVMELTNMEGNTLTFESDDEKVIKLNLEKSGLKLVNSNFLPEYEGFYFRKISKI